MASDQTNVRTDQVKDKDGQATVNPSSVPRAAVQVPKKTVGGIEVNTRPPDTDIADIRADDTPEQAAEKIKAVRAGRVKSATK